MLYLGTDHRGFELKGKIKEWVESQEEPSYAGETRDLSPEYDKDDDYPVISAQLGRYVASDSLNMGILLCGSGVGASAAVNKIKGVRGALGLSEDQVRAGRHDDDMNVLVIAADHTPQAEAEQMVRVFLATEFDSGTERYQRRIDQITALENE